MPTQHILADALTLFQRRGQIMPTTLLICKYLPLTPSRFQSFLRLCYFTSIACEDCSFWQVLIPIIVMDQALICLLKLLYILPILWFPFNQLEVVAFFLLSNQYKLKVLNISIFQARFQKILLAHTKISKPNQQNLDLLRSTQHLLSKRPNHEKDFFQILCASQKFLYSHHLEISY